MKTDDDIFVNVAALTDHLKAENADQKIQGCIKNGPQGAPQPLSVSGVQFRPAHPPFTAGAGYVISGDLVQPLYMASLQMKLIRYETIHFRLPEVIIIFAQEFYEFKRK
jgi:Galactosyltransferase